MSRYELKKGVEELIDQYNLEGEQADLLRLKYENLTEAIKQYKEALQNLLNIAFNIVEKKDKKHKLDDKFKDDKSFAEFLKRIMSAARESIEEVIVDRDDLAWYTIDYDRGYYYYSLSLPEEMIDLSQAPSLVEFRDKYLIK